MILHTGFDCVGLVGVVAIGEAEIRGKADGRTIIARDRECVDVSDEAPGCKGYKLVETETLFLLPAQ